MPDHPAVMIVVGVGLLVFGLYYTPAVQPFAGWPESAGSHDHRGMLATGGKLLS